MGTGLRNDLDDKVSSSLSIRFPFCSDLPYIEFFIFQSLNQDSEDIPIDSNDLEVVQMLGDAPKELELCGRTSILTEVSNLHHSTPRKW